VLQCAAVTDVTFSPLLPSSKHSQSRAVSESHHAWARGAPFQVCSSWDIGMGCVAGPADWNPSLLMQQAHGSCCLRPCCRRSGGFHAPSSPGAHGMHPQQSCFDGFPTTSRSLDKETATLQYSSTARLCIYVTAEFLQALCMLYNLLTNKIAYETMVPNT